MAPKIRFGSGDDAYSVDPSKALSRVSMHTPPGQERLFEALGFLRYQRTWYGSEKLAAYGLKSSQIRFSFTTAFWAAKRAMAGHTVLYVTRTEDHAKEWLTKYVKPAIEVFSGVARLDGQKGKLANHTSLNVHFTKTGGGGHIKGMASNPDSIQAITGDIILDEFGRHDEQEELHTVAVPRTTLGYALRILTAPGLESEYHADLWKSIQDDDGWLKMRVTIEDAIKQGLTDRFGKPVNIRDILSKAGELKHYDQTGTYGQRFRQMFMCQFAGSELCAFNDDALEMYRGSAVGPMHELTATQLMQETV